MCKYNQENGLVAISNMRAALARYYWLHRKAGNGNGVGAVRHAVSAVAMRFAIQENHAPRHAPWEQQFAALDACIEEVLAQNVPFYCVVF